MTIGIAAFGPNSEHAVRRGVAMAEFLGRGAIGGFAVLSVLDDRGEHRQVVCQDGGVDALAPLTSGPALCAAIISSGPNRPEPLSQFLPGRAGVGLVTGHRLPNRIGAEGEPANASALRRMADGLSPAAAVRAELDANPELDFGLIAVSADGRIGFGDSKRVSRRTDLGVASQVEKDRGYALLCNSIYCLPGLSLAETVGGIVWSALTGTASAFFVAELAGAVPITPAAEDRIELDDRDRVVAIGTAEPRTIENSNRTAAIYLRVPVFRNGEAVGRTASELFARVEEGRAVADPTGRTQFAVERLSHVPA